MAVHATAMKLGLQPQSFRDSGVAPNSLTLRVEGLDYGKGQHHEKTTIMLCDVACPGKIRQLGSLTVAKG